MKKYWDVSEKKRAELTDDEMERLEKIELMEAGVIPIDPPVKPDIPEVKVATVRMYRVAYAAEYASLGNNSFDCVFETSEQAEAFVALKPRRFRNNYNEPDSYDDEPRAQYAVIPSDLAVPDAIAASKGKLADARRLKDAYESDLREYTKMQEKNDKALLSMRDDRMECCSEAQRFTKMRDVLADYVKTCEGDNEMAMKFLLKAHTQDDVSAMGDWFAVEEAF